MVERSDGNLAATKLRPPALPARLVDRARLDDLLDAARTDAVPLVLVCAPAGSGKSTLVAAWAARHGEPVAWLQLEEGDADPARFWVSVTAAIGRARPEVARAVEPLVSGSFGADEVVVPALVNELSAPGRPLVLVLDDYHLVDEPMVHRGMERLVGLCPPEVTIVLVTRAEPPFRLGRLRVRGRVREVRATDLRFAPAEAADLLGGVAGLDDERIGELCERTEGWAAGLVLAGLSIAGTADARRFVETFRGDDRLVAGYLTDELLDTLDGDERRRMVEAAVLHRLSGGLLDAVTGSTDGDRWLAGLAARNQLVVRLDATGEWYRYHHLFRDLLLLEARRSMADRLPGLHRRAAAWFEEAGYPAAAVEHLLAAGDRTDAMLLMRLVGPDLLGTGRLRTLRTLLARLADGGELDGICSILAGWERYLTGRYDEAQQLLDRGAAILEPDVDPMRAMPLRINLALGTGDVGTALTGARAVVAAGDVAGRPSELATATGAAFAWAGLADDAIVVLAVALERTAAEKRSTAHAMALVAAAVVELHRGDDAAAHRAAERALDHAAARGLAAYHGIAPALAIRATTGGSAQPVADAERAVQLAHAATTRLGLALVLTLAGDVLLTHGVERGHALLDEARRTVDACADPGITGPLLDRVAARHRSTASRPAAPVGLVDELSAREAAVLRYLPSALSLPDIARELYVSPNTVKTQCRAIYRKLGVNDRRAAVQAARARRLL